MNDAVVLVRKRKRKKKQSRTTQKIIDVLKDPGISGWTSREICHELGKYMGTIASAIFHMKRKNLIRVNCTRMCTITHTYQDSYTLVID